MGLAIVISFALAAVFAQYISPYDPTRANLGVALQGPSLAHLLGTDHLGRDILSRIIHGGQTSLLMGVVAVGIAMAIGLPIGLVAGYYGKFWDLALMRLVDVMLSFPGLLLAILIVAVLGPSVENAMVAVGISSVPLFARLIRGSALSIKELEYVEAARVIGLNDAGIILKYILPNCLSPVLVQATLRIGTAILTAAGLSFLGLGAQPPLPEWGAMLSQGRDYIQMANHIAAFPGLAIMLVVLGFNLLGDALSESLNPQLG